MTLDGDRFESCEIATPTDRIVLAGAGAVCLLPMVELFGRRGLDAFQTGYLPFWFIALPALALAVALIAGALVGGTRTVVVDAARGDVRVVTRFWKYARTRAFPLAASGPLDLAEDDGTPPGWRLSLRDDRGRFLRLRDFTAREDGLRVRAALEAMLG